MLKISTLVFVLMLILINEVKAGEESLYDFLWLDPDKKVYVLQNKLFKKEKTFYFDVGYISNITSKFQDTNGYSLKGGYYFHEEWGVEGFYNSYNNKKNDDFRNVSLVNSAEPFVRRLNSTYGAAIIYSPFYGKINTFNTIYYFDWSFGAGYTQLNTESNVKTVTRGGGYQKEVYNGALLKTKLTLHLQENIHVGLEYMNTYYRAPGPKNPDKNLLRTNSDIILSVGFSY